MSGTIGSNIVRHSGTIAETAAGLSWTTAVVTGSTVTVEAGNGYFIDTTSNACTVTLPSSAEAGDQIVLVDYDRTWGTNAITIDSNGLNYQGEADTFTVEYTTDGQSINLVYSDSTKGWLPLEDDVVADEPVFPQTQKGIIAYGSGHPAGVNVSNLITSSGVVGSDTSGVGTTREGLAAATYGTDKAIFAYGHDGTNYVSMSNLVNNSGVVASDVTGVGTARGGLEAAEYGTDKAIFAYGTTGSYVSMSNLVNNSGVIASDVTGVGTARAYLAATRYGLDKAIFGFGHTGSRVSMTNLVSNTGVIASDVTGVGTARSSITGTGYGTTGQALFAYGYTGSAYTAASNLISNTGVVATDTSGTNDAKTNRGATNYGGDKAIFAFGYHADTDSKINTRNLVSNVGVIAADASGAGTARQVCPGAGYSTSA